MKYCQCRYVEGTHPVTTEHTAWVREQRQKEREQEQQRGQPVNVDDLVRQTMRASLADPNADPMLAQTPTLPDNSSGDEGIISAVVKSFEAVLAQARTSGSKPKQPTRKEQSEDLLRQILQNIERTTLALEPARIALLDVDLRWKAVDTAVEELAAAAKALQGFDDAAQEKIFVVQRLRILENLVLELQKDLPPDTRPYYYDCEYVFKDPMANLDVVAQLMVLLGLVCTFIMNMSKNSVEFILGIVTLMIKYTMLIPTATSQKPNKEAQDESYTDMQQHIIDQLPTSLHSAMSKLNLDGKTVLFAACPSCHHTHPPTLSTSKEPTWPATCDNMVVGKKGRSVCGRPLLNSRKKGARPIKPFLSPCFLDYLARLVSDPATEKLLDDSCQSTEPTAPSAASTNDIFTGRHIYNFVRDIFKGKFLQTFKGRDKLLFIDPGPNNRMKLVFGFSLDFFPPFGSRKRSNSNSIGLLVVYCLNLPLSVRYLPENMHISIITGKHEPRLEGLNPYLRPIVDVGVIAWERGIHLSRTALSRKGRIVEAVFPLSVNDLPAARKVSGLTGHRGHIFCTVCDLRGRKNLYRTDFENWKMRDKDQMRADAEAWRDANTRSEREAIFQRAGTRYSELWRWIYWDPTIMLIVDAMHALFEGVGAFFTREVLQINLEDAKKREEFVPAFTYDFTSFDSEDETIPKDVRPDNDAAEKDISSIHRLLVSPLRAVEPEPEPEPEPLSDSDDGNLTDDEIPTKPQKRAPVGETAETIQAKLAKKRKTALIFVCWSLNLASNPVPPDPRTGAIIKWEDYLLRVTRERLAELLMGWRMSQPLRRTDAPDRPKTITMPDLRFIQQVIVETDTPAWVHHVPHNYGEPAAGSMKADQMRLLMTIYLPIALVIMWAEQTGPDAAHFRKLLLHAMALFQAVTIVCRYATTPERATAYRKYMKQWIDDLYTCHPHTIFMGKRTNPHVALHIYDFMKLWGPVLSWWAFPVERLIGLLQKTKSNGRVGGEHEATILTTWLRGANLRRWIKRPNCPKVLQEFHRLFMLHHGSDLDNPGARPGIESQPRKKGLRDGEQAYYDFAGMHFSRAETHTGNSLVSYLDGEGKTWFGSIEKIKVTPQGSVSFAIRHQDPLPHDQNDPFLEFPHFPARTYSSKMANTLVDVRPNQVLGHYARFRFSGGRAVVLDLRRD